MGGDAHLFRVAEFLEDVVVILASDAFWKADDRLDVRLERTFQQLVDLAVVVVVVADAEHALDVVPDGAPEARRIHVLDRTHRVVRQVVRQPELVIDQVAHVVVQPVDERKRVVVPRIVLQRSKNRHSNIWPTAKNRGRPKWQHTWTRKVGMSEVSPLRAKSW